MTGESSNWRAELAIQEDWQKANRKDKTDGMSQKAVMHISVRIQVLN